MLGQQRSIAKRGKAIGCPKDSPRDHYCLRKREMSEIGDVFNAMREAGRLKRAENRASSLELLKAEGFRPEVKNAGAHLRMKGKRWAADLWPGTGLWYIREKGKPQREGRGVHRLIDWMRNLQKRDD